MIDDGFATPRWHWSICGQGGRGEDRSEPAQRTGQRTELSNVRETGRKIEGKTGQRTELSKVWETVWKIEGMTEETARPKPGQRTASRNRHEDRGEPLPEDPCADGERSEKPRYN